MTGTATDRRWGVRSIAALLVFVIAFVITPVALVGHWGHRTVIDAQRYIDTVGPLAATPEVQQALTDAVTEAVVPKMNTEENVSGLLGNLFGESPIAQSLAGPISAGVDGLVSELIARFVASDQFQTLWIEVNTLAQQGVVRILEGEPDSIVSLQGQDVVLDVTTLVTSIQQYLVDNGVSIAGSITLPDKDRTIVLMQSPALQQIRWIYGLTSPILQWLPLIVAALFALAIGLARRRARMVVAVGIGVLVSAGLIKVGLDIGQKAFVDQLSTTVFAPASTVFWNTLFAYLVSGLYAISALGILGIVAGWLGGRTKSATAVRGHLTRGFGELSARLPEGLQSFGASLAPHQVRIRVVIYALTVLLILMTDMLSLTSVLWCAALGAGVVTVLQILVAKPAAPAAPAIEAATAL